MELVATCLFGLEKILGQEIDAMGCRRLDTMDGRVTFEGDFADIARANIRLRCAERIYIKLGAFRALSFTDLFEGTKALPWETFIGRNDAFPVKGHAIKSKLFSVPDCQSIVKKAVVDRLSSRYGVRWLSESSGVKYQIDFFLFKDVATLMIDTSGIALHKRGYRPQSGVAPIRETLAAAMVYTSRPREDVLFWDPFCGSGTIAIEAARIALNMAPGLDRSFAAEAFPCVPESMWREAREASRAAMITDSVFEAYASDIDEDCLALTRENAKRAGVADYIRVFRADARKIEKEDRRGTVVCNPPYGERLMEKDEVCALYRQIGKAFRDLYPWQVYIITSFPEFEKYYGARADRAKKLYNGMIPCHLYQYYKPKDI